MLLRLICKALDILVCLIAGLAQRPYLLVDRGELAMDRIGFPAHTQSLTQLFQPFHRVYLMF